VTDLLVLLGVLVLGGVVLAVLAKVILVAWVLVTYLRGLRQDVVTSRRRER